MLKKLLWLLVCIFVFVSCRQEPSGKYSQEIEYLIYKPQEYSEIGEKKWPLVIFLHGSSERGNNLEKVKKHGLPELVKKGNEFPFLIISPQAKHEEGWNLDLLYGMIKDFVKSNNIDEDKIYLTGTSMGGFGTWKLAQKHPELFAAIIPICGGGNPRDIWKLRHMPIWNFHGGKDKLVPIEASHRLIETIKPINPNVRFTIYPETGHSSWIKAYNEPELYKWMLSQKKYKPKKSVLTLENLKLYEGDYNVTFGGKDQNVNIKENKGELLIHFRNNKLDFISSDKHTFFWKENPLYEINFKQDSLGMIKGLIFYGDEITNAKKIK